MNRIEKYIELSKNADLLDEQAYYAAKAYLAAKAKIKEYKELQGGAKVRAQEVLADNDFEPVPTEVGDLRWIEPTTTARYDTKGLDSVAMAMPELAGIIAPFRKEGQRKGYVTVK